MHTSLGTTEESNCKHPKFSHIASITCGIHGIRHSVFLHNKIAQLVLFCLNIRAFFPCAPPLMTCRIGSAVGKLPDGCHLSSMKCGYTLFCHCYVRFSRTHFVLFGQYWGEKLQLFLRIQYSSLFSGEKRKWLPFLSHE